MLLFSGFLICIDFAGITYNVLALANPKGLSAANAERVVDLALQGCHVNLLLCQTPLRDRGACDVALNAVLYDGSSDTSSS